MRETSTDVVKRYLIDAIAAEKSFETQLESFAKEDDNAAAKQLFDQHALQTRSQHERLTARLDVLGGSSSGVGNLLAHIFGVSREAAQIEHEKEERTTRNLMVAYAVENSELAMYEALALIAEAAGDSETESLARTIQQEEKSTAEKMWQLLPGAALEAYQHS